MCFLDDIIVTGGDDQAHLTSLEQILQKLDNCGLKCKLEKCRFMQDNVDYLGHKIDARGLHPLDTKVTAITRAPSPTNVMQLRSFLGMVNYYGKFLPNLATVLAPLHLLLRRGYRWIWDHAQEAAFAECKRLLTSVPVLAHFSDQELPLECDASLTDWVRSSCSGRTVLSGRLPTLLVHYIQPKRDIHNWRKRPWL